MDRSNRFDILNVTESGQEFEEVNAVDVVQEIVEIIVDAGATKNVWPIEGRYEDKGDHDGEVGGHMRQSDTCGRRCETGIRLGRQQVQHGVLGRCCHKTFGRRECECRQRERRVRTG